MTKNNSGWINPKKIKPAYKKAVIGAVKNKETGEIESKEVVLLCTNELGDHYLETNRDKWTAVLPESVDVIAWMPFPTYVEPKKKK